MRTADGADAHKQYCSHRVLAVNGRKESWLAASGGEHDVGSQWLGTFAVYLLTRRGIAR